MKYSANLPRHAARAVHVEDERFEREIKYLTSNSEVEIGSDQGCLNSHVGMGVRSIPVDVSILPD